MAKITAERTNQFTGSGLFLIFAPPLGNPKCFRSKRYYGEFGSIGAILILIKRFFIRNAVSYDSWDPVGFQIQMRKRMAARTKPKIPIPISALHAGRRYFPETSARAFRMLSDVMSDMPYKVFVFPVRESSTATEGVPGTLNLLTRVLKYCMPAMTST